MASDKPIQQGASNLAVGASDWVQVGNDNFNKEMLWKCFVKY